jgi:hypothetical protein
MFKQSFAVLAIALFGLNVLCPMAVLLGESDVTGPEVKGGEVAEVVATHVEQTPLMVVAEAPSQTDLRHTELDAKTLVMEDVLSHDQKTKVVRSKILWAIAPKEGMDMAIVVYTMPETKTDFALVFSYAEGAWKILPVDFK